MPARRKHSLDHNKPFHEIKAYGHREHRLRKAQRPIVTGKQIGRAHV